MRVLVADMFCVFIVFPLSGCDISPARPFSRWHKMYFHFLTRKFRSEPATPRASFYCIVARAVKIARACEKLRRRGVRMTTVALSREQVTRLLGAWRGGDQGAFGKLIPLVEPELHRLATNYTSRARSGHTLQTTALLDEAYLRLVDNTRARWQNRTQFIAVAA